MSELLIIAEHRRGELNPATQEAIAGAQRIKRNSDTLAVAVIAASPDDYVPALSLEGVDQIIKVKSPTPEFQVDFYEAAVLKLIETRTPEAVLIPHTINAWSYAPAIAIMNNLGLATDVFGLRRVEDQIVATRAAYSEKIHMEMDFPGKATVILTIRANTFSPIENQASPQVSEFSDNDIDKVALRSEHVRFIEPEADSDVDITQSEFLLSIGRGIGEEEGVEQFSQLADAIGFTLGCSRPIADNGWLPKSRQVGQSGKTASSCRAYIAMGISGSVQHLAGMKHVPLIIAINKDPEASIFSVAHYGIVGDIFDIAGELTNHFQTDATS